MQGANGCPDRTRRVLGTFTAYSNGLIKGDYTANEAFVSPPPERPPGPDKCGLSDASPRSFYAERVR